MAIRKVRTKAGIRYVAYFKYRGRQITKRFPRRSEAAAWEAEEKKRLRSLESQPCALMFSALMNAYLTDCESRMQPNTVREKFSHGKEFAAFRGADFPASELSASEAGAFIARIYTDKGSKAANRRLRTMKACWNWGKEKLPDNPWRRVRPYSEDEKTKYVPPPQDVAAVMTQAETWEARLLLFILGTGARIGEVFSLTWEDVNFDRQTVTLWTRKRKAGSRQARRLPLTPRLTVMLRELEQESGGNAHVFINPATGGPYRKLQPCVRYLLKRLCVKAKVKSFGFHALRHFVASRLMESNQANIVEIQQLLGHQRSTTTDLYLRSLSSGIAHLAGIIEEAVLPVCGSTDPQPLTEQGEDHG